VVRRTYIHNKKDALRSEAEGIHGKEKPEWASSFPSGGRLLGRARGPVGKIFADGLSKEGVKGEAFLPGDLKEPGQIFNGKCY